MWALLLTTILTSAVDSLNPIAITQQFVLQGMVRRPRDIWYFILPTGITNLIGGFLAYYGLTAFIGAFFRRLMAAYGQAFYTVVLILGMGCLALVVLMIQNRKLEALSREVQALKGDREGESDEEVLAHRIKSVAPLALIGLGVGATFSELTTALPYFAFLAVLFNYELALYQVSFILLIYNTIYTLPLMILYFVYMGAREKFDRLYLLIKMGITRWSGILGPALVGIIGAALIYHAVTRLLG